MKKLILPLLILSSNLFADFPEVAKEADTPCAPEAFAANYDGESIKLINECIRHENTNACRLLEVLTELQQVEGKMRSQGISTRVVPALSKCLSTDPGNATHECKAVKLALRWHMLYSELNNNQQFKHFSRYSFQDDLLKHTKKATK